MKPWRAREAELILAGAPPNGLRVFRRAADAALAEAKPSGDNGFKIELARRIVVRALALASPARPSACPRFQHPPSPLFPEMSSMPEIALTQTPAHVRHGSNIGQPLTRRDGILKVTGAARYAADHHPPGMLYAVLAVSSIARGRVTFLDVQAAKAHPGVVEVMTPANKTAARPGSGREKPIPSCFGSISCKMTGSDTPTSRSPSSSHNARGRDGRRSAAVAALRHRYGAGWTWMRARVFVPPAVGPGNPAAAPSRRS